MGLIHGFILHGFVQKTQSLHHQFGPNFVLDCLFMDVAKVVVAREIIKCFDDCCVTGFVLDFRLESDFVLVLHAFLRNKGIDDSLETVSCHEIFNKPVEESSFD